MERFKINIEYFTNGTYYSTNLFETEHFKVGVTANTDHIKLILRLLFILSYKYLL